MPYVTNAYSPDAVPPRWLSETFDTVDAAAVTAQLWFAAGCTAVTVTRLKG